MIAERASVNNGRFFAFWESYMNAMKGGDSDGKTQYPGQDMP